MSKFCSDPGVSVNVASHFWVAPLYTKTMPFSKFEALTSLSSAKERPWAPASEERTLTAFCCPTLTFISAIYVSNSESMYYLYFMILVYY